MCGLHLKVQMVVNNEEGMLVKEGRWHRCGQNQLFQVSPNEKMDEA